MGEFGVRKYSHISCYTGKRVNFLCSFSLLKDAKASTLIFLIAFARHVTYSFFVNRLTTATCNISLTNKLLTINYAEL